MPIDKDMILIFPILTITQKRLLSFIMWHFMKKHHAPSYREMSLALNIRGNPSAKLMALEKKGYIVRSNRIRGIELTNLSYDYLEVSDLEKWEK
jgi:SOS-response transcriptional repressor LexA